MRSNGRAVLRPRRAWGALRIFCGKVSARCRARRGCGGKGTGTSPAGGKSPSVPLGQLPHLRMGEPFALRRGKRKVEVSVKDAEGVPWAPSRSLRPSPLRGGLAFVPVSLYPKPERARQRAAGCPLYLRSALPAPSRRGFSLKTENFVLQC